MHEWRGQYDPELAAEDTSRVTWEIEPQDGGVSKLTVVHDQLEGAPRHAALVGGAYEGEGAGGGHAWVLSDLKTLLETGKSFND